MTDGVMRFSRQLLAAATVMVGTMAVCGGCTSRSASEENDLAEPDIAVVPDVDPAPPRGEIRLVDGLLSSKRLPGGGFRALIDLLLHREKSRSRLYDRAIKELVKVACEYDDLLVSAVIDGSSLAEIYPLDRLHDADAAGCGFFLVNGRKLRGALFDNGCFAVRLAAVTAAFANGDEAPLAFDKCPMAINEPKKTKSGSPPPPTMGSAVVSPGAVPTATGAGSGAGQGSALLQKIALPVGTGAGVGSGAPSVPANTGTSPGAGSGGNTVPGTGAGAVGSGSGSGAGSGVSPKMPQDRVPATRVGSPVAPTQGS
ncbi:MAG: hypothetical protein KBG15_05340 [Kofleriaceae bacterium]|nr:hypothetical protein [Kofleriaceae bacterium]